MRLSSAEPGCSLLPSQQAPFGAVPVRHQEVLSAPHVLLLKAGAVSTPQPPPAAPRGLWVCVEGGVLSTAVAEDSLRLQFRSWRADPGFEGTLLAQ